MSRKHSCCGWLSCETNLVEPSRIGGRFHSAGLTSLKCWCINRKVFLLHHHQHRQEPNPANMTDPKPHQPPAKKAKLESKDPLVPHATSSAVPLASVIWVDDPGWFCTGCRQEQPLETHDHSSFHCQCSREFCDACASKLPLDTCCPACAHDHASSKPNRGAYDDGCVECEDGCGCDGNCDCWDQMQRRIICLACQQKTERKEAKERGTKRKVDEAELDKYLSPSVISKLDEKCVRTLAASMQMTSNQLSSLPEPIRKQVVAMRTQIVAMKKPAT